MIGVKTIKNAIMQDQENTAQTIMKSTLNIKETITKKIVHCYSTNMCKNSQNLGITKDFISKDEDTIFTKKIGQVLQN